VASMALYAWKRYSAGMNKQQRLVLVVSILASLVAFLDGSVVNVALPAIANGMHGGLVVQQWVVDAYLLTLGSLILIAGSLSDLIGRRRILQYGLVGFGVASVLCAVAPTSAFLIGARALQGAAGALLVPSSLAIIIATFSGAAQGKAIGSWTAWTGISFIIGPLVGGALVDAGSWRSVFWINVIPIAITLWLLAKLDLPAQDRGSKKVDFMGAWLCTLGLLGTVFALIEQPHFGWSNPLIWLPGLLGVAMLVAFVWYEGRVKDPMLPLELFKIRNFSYGNLATTFIYAALSVATFVLVVFEQQFGKYTALEAGLSLIPVTAIMFFLSPRAGALAGKYGPRWFMTIGPLVAAAGFLSMLRVNASVNYWTDILPGVLLFGVGLSITVAPLTAAVLGSIKPEHAGIGSAVNNAIARIAGLVAVAAIGLIVGGQLNLNGFYRGVWVMATMLAAGGLISWIGIRKLEAK
jgi:EmrB/QacA subfamily drug resistance transporter